MRIIFLDFDGVLNSNRFFIESNHHPDFFLEDSKMELLKQIVDATDAKIVLSTSWREVWDTDLVIAKKLREYFSSYHLDVYGCTGSIDFDRYLEIKDWIIKHNIESYCVLDDITGPWYELEDHVIITNTTGDGLTKDHVKKAIEILKSK